MVELGDFKECGWIVFQRKIHPTIYDSIQEAWHRKDISPKGLHHYVAAHEAIFLVEENMGIAVVPMGIAASIRNPGISIKPLEERGLQLVTYLALSANQPSRLVNEFSRAFLRASGILRQRDQRQHEGREVQLGLAL